VVGVGQLAQLCVDGSGSGPHLGGVVEDEGDLRDLLHVVAPRHEQRGDGGGRQRRAHGVPLLLQVHAAVPPAPRLTNKGRGEAHVTSVACATATAFVGVTRRRWGHPRRAHATVSRTLHPAPHTQRVPRHPTPLPRDYLAAESGG